MSKVYTAQELRVRANLENNVWGDKTTAAMLLQAADALEREDNREKKKYEYSIRFGENKINRDYIFESEEYARTIAGDSLQVVRREVGEWEEVK